MRYRARTFSYVQCLTDKYPPFDYKPSTGDPGGAGVTVSVSPKLEGRNRLSAGWVRVDARLWAYSMLLTDEYPPFSID